MEPNEIIEWARAPWALEVLGKDHNQKGYSDAIIRCFK